MFHRHPTKEGVIHVLPHPWVIVTFERDYRLFTESASSHESPRLQEGITAVSQMWESVTIAPSTGGLHNNPNISHWENALHHCTIAPCHCAVPRWQAQRRYSLLASEVNPAMVRTVRFYNRNELYGSPDVRNCRMPNFFRLNIFCY